MMVVSEIYMLFVSEVFDPPKKRTQAKFLT